MSKIKSRGFRQSVQEDTMTYDNPTEEIHQSQRSTYREWDTGLQGHVCYWGEVQNTTMTRVAVSMGCKWAGA